MAHVLLCGHCGSPLPRPAPGARFVTCRFCEATTDLDTGQHQPSSNGRFASLSQRFSAQVPAFEQALAERVARGEAPLAAFRGAAESALSTVTNPETLTNVAFGIALDYRQITGIDVTWNARAVGRIALQYLEAVEGIWLIRSQMPATTGDETLVIEAPALIDTPQGPLDFKQACTLRRLHELAATPPTTSLPRSPAPALVPAPAPRPQPRPRKSLSILLVLIFGPMVLGLAILAIALASGSSAAQKLERFNYNMSKVQAAKLFDVQPSQGDISVRFDGSIIDSVKIHYGGPNGTFRYSDMGPDYGFSLYGGKQASASKMVQRLRALARRPFQPSSWKLETHHGSLEVDSDYTVIRARDIPSAALADKYWAVAVYLAYGKPHPTPAQIAAINGR